MISRCDLASSSSMSICFKTCGGGDCTQCLEDNEGGGGESGQRFDDNACGGGVMVGDNSPDDSEMGLIVEGYLVASVSLVG